MDLLKIKQLVKHNGDKFIFVENGEPELVMMSFQEYEKLNGLAAPRKHADNFIPYHKPSIEPVDFGLEDINETEFMSPPRTETAGLPVRTEGIRLEDLPI